jgi:DivIVA domain-containing protein
MPLTPEDVRNKRFTPVRLREGYDMGEVDQFLDEVEAELERLTLENDELRAKVAAASSGEPTSRIAHAAERRFEPPAEPIREPEPAPRPPAPVFAAAPSVPAPSIGDASSAAARLLEIASANADQLMEAAKEEADRIIGEAQVKADRITGESQLKAERVETDARVRAQKLDEETSERRAHALAGIDRDRADLQREIDHLRAYEREYRARLKNYFQTQLDQISANETAEPGASSSPAPKRAKTMLSSEEV